MSQDVRLANEAWESMFRAQVLLARHFSDDDVWDEVSPTEYDVLYTLSKADDGLSMVEINREVLLTQAGISRLCHRLVRRGLLERRDDPHDRRAARIVLTLAGRDVQRAVGRRHGRAVAAAMTRALDHDQLVELRDLTRRLSAAGRPPAG